MHRATIAREHPAYYRARRGHRMLTVGYGGSSIDAEPRRAAFRPETPADQLPAIITDALCDLMILAAALGHDPDHLTDTAWTNFQATYPTPNPDPVCCSCNRALDEDEHGFCNDCGAAEARADHEIDHRRATNH